MESNRNIDGLTERYVVTLEHRDADYWTPHETAARLSARRDHDSQRRRSGEWRLFWSRRQILSTGVTLPNTSDVDAPERLVVINRSGLSRSEFMRPAKQS